MSCRVNYIDPNHKVCPKCGSKNIQSLSRITGYLSFDERFGDGKTKERLGRVAHGSLSGNIDSNT